MYRILSGLSFTAIILSLLLLCCASALRAQTGAAPAFPASELPVLPAGTPGTWAVKTNLLYGAGALAPNLGFEVGVARRSTLDFAGGYNGWGLDGTGTDNQKRAHWIAKGEYRYWFCERLSGHFIGGHALYSQYNIAGHEMPLLLGRGSKDYRYEGWVVGAGVAYGYDWMIHRRWNIEFTLGVGYGYMRYDQYRCVHCGQKTAENQQRNYFGPTAAGISLVYLIK